MYSDVNNHDGAVAFYYLILIIRNAPVAKVAKEEEGRGAAKRGGVGENFGVWDGSSYPSHRKIDYLED